jgi:hypothetical protein
LSSGEVSQVRATLFRRDLRDKLDSGPFILVPDRS